MSITTMPPSVPDLLGTSPADLIDQAAPVATRDAAVRRAERIRAGLASYAAMRQDIADAYAQRDWVALGHGSWHEYLEAEFGDELRALNPIERSEAARDLRRQGLTTRQIAKATGVSVGTAHSDTAGVQPLNTSKVTGSDGKQYAATRPPAAAEPTSDVPERPKPPAWDPAERKAHEAEVLRIKDIEAAQRQVQTLVTDVRALIFTVLQGSRQDKTALQGLITRDMVADLRRAVDLLEGEIDDDA